LVEAGHESPERGFLISIVLEWLSVDPDYRHQGIATMLVNCGIMEANKLGFDTYVHSMQGGLGVYLRNGFTLKEELIQDDPKSGGKGEHIAYAMIKEATEARQLGASI
jgi:GNAT superfamily N-acetyltransferase